VGIFSEDPDGRFSLTPLAEPLLSGAPDSIASYATMTGSDWFYNTWGQLPYSLRSGEPAFDFLHGKSMFEYLTENPAAAQIFNDGMTATSMPESAAIVSACDFSSVRKLVDVGGGHGLLLSAILKKYPEMKGVLFDSQPVIENALSVFAEPPLSGRCECMAGDFFHSVPQNGDTYILKYIIHDWDDENALTILRNCREAMAQDGRVLVVEIIVSEGNTPCIGKFLDLLMLLFLRGFERTETEYRNLFERAGFTINRIVPTPSPLSVIELVKK